MKVPDLIIPPEFDYDKFIKITVGSRIKFICVVDIFQKKTLSFKNFKDYKKLKELYENDISAARFIADLKAGKYDSILDKPFNSRKK